jgi:hypothetical protein
MEHRDIEDHQEERAVNQGERKPYATPQLTEYGSMKVLTQSGTGTVPDMGAGRAPCWVAVVLYGEHDWQTHLLRWYIVGPLSQHMIGRWFANLYRRYGQQVAWLITQHPTLQGPCRLLFDRLLQNAVVAARTRVARGVQD